MYCHSCGHDNISGANFCVNCGNKVNTAQETTILENIQKNSTDQIGRQRCRCGEIKRNVFKDYKFTSYRVCLRCEIKGFCPVCGNKLRTKSAEQCGNCGSSWRENAPIQNVQIRQIYHEKFTKNQVEEIKCPRCKSTQITAHKKGFSGLKAVGGAVLTGGIGILAGTIGSNKILLTCLSCGNKFKIGEDFEGLKRKRKREEEAMKSPVFWMLFLGVLAILIWLLNSC
jgi:hypothetical protein